MTSVYSITGEIIEKIASNIDDEVFGQVAAKKGYSRCDRDAMVECSRCGAMTSFDDGAMPTEDRALDLWNRRAERTCRPVHTREKWECGACGCEIMPGFMPVFKGAGVLRYCPNCGARVEEDR